MGTPHCDHHRGRRIEEARRLRDVLRYEIGVSDSSLKLLPDERELTARFGCSRNVLREALDLLRNDRVIERRQGVGTFVTGKPPAISSEQRGLVEELNESSDRVRYRLVEFVEAPSSGSIATLLSAVDEPMMVFTRATSVNGTPIVLWDTYVRGEIGRNLPLSNAEVDIFDLYGLAGIEIRDFRLRVQAVRADISTVDLLETEVGEPLFRFERIMFDANDRIVGLSFGRARADRFALSFSSATSNHPVRAFDVFERDDWLGSVLEKPRR